jgi:hypothetical protein
MAGRIYEVVGIVMDEVVGNVMDEGMNNESKK